LPNLTGKALSTPFAPEHAGSSCPFHFPIHFHSTPTKKPKTLTETMNTRTKPPTTFEHSAESISGAALSSPNTMTKRWRPGLLSRFAVVVMALMMALFASNGRATSLLTDDFNYTAATLLTANGWTAHSGGGTNAITVVNPGLTYLGYAGSGVGNAVSMVTSGEDDNKTFTAVTSGSVYCAFMVNASAAQTTGDYFLHFQTGTSTFGGKVWIKKDPTLATFAFGVSKATSTASAAVFTPFSYSVGTTYLVVVKYTYNAAAGDDAAVLFVNPTLGGSEPSATITAAIEGTDMSTITAVGLRQGTAGSMPTVKIDGVRVATTWAEAAAAVTYTVTYNGNTSDGGTAPTDPSSPYVAGSTVTTLSQGTLTKSGFTFTGWNTVANGSGTSYSAGATFAIGANTTLYAQWVASGYTVTYNGNTNTGGTAPVDGTTYTSGSNVTVLGPGTLVKTGYTFAHWNTAANDSGTSYNPSDTITSIAANVTLYAQWTINSYTVTYNGNTNTGGTAPVDGSSPYTFGSTVTVLGPGTLVKAANTFAGWNTASDGSGTSYAPAATFTLAGNTTLYAIWTSGATISGAATATAFTTTYGTPSTAQTFSVSGVNLTTDLVATAPTGLEVSSDGSTYGGTATFVQSGGSASGTLSVRLAATASATGSYNSLNVVLTSTGATPVNIATAASGNSVSPKGLTITGLTGVNKPYDRTTSASATGTAAYSGLVNGESFSVTGTPTFSFATKTVGTAKPITVLGYTAPSTNYTVTQPALSADITAIALTVSNAVVTPKVYDGTTTATITGATLVGVISGDTVTVSGGGTFADPNVATGISVTTALTLGGADAGNYALTQPTLTGNITQAPQNISFAALPDKLISDVPFNLTATVGSGLTVTFASDNPAVATVSGTQVTIVGAGIANITASQPGNSNYSAATDVVRPLTVSPPALASWDFTGPGALVSQTATVSGAHLATVPNLIRGATAASSAGANSFRTVGFKNEGVATSNTDYFETSFTAAGGYTLSLSTIDARFNGTAGYFASPGVTSLFAYSLDGTNFTPIGLGVTSTSLTMAQLSLSSITALQNVPSSTTVTIRYYASGQTTTGGWGFSSPVAGSFGLNVVGTTTAIYTITSSAGANGSITPLGATAVASGGSQAYTITPAANYHVADVLVDGGSVGALGGYTFTNVIAAHTISASFAIDTHTVTYNGNGSTGGTAPVDGGSPYDYNSTVTVMGAGTLVKTGYTFTGWNTASDGSGTSYSPGGTFSLTADTTLFAQWLINSYTLTYTAGSNGSITGTSPQTVNYGDSGTAVTAVPDLGYHFVQWNDASTANPRTDTNVTGDVGVTATFALNTYTLTYTAGANGSITGTSPQTVGYGGSGTAVTAVPDTGYHFVQWSDASTANPRTDTNVTASASYTATFAINTYTVTYNGNGFTGGTAPVDVTAHPHGSTVTVLGAGSLVKTGYSFSGWNTAANGSGTSYSPAATFTITANTTLFAQWTLPSNGGTISFVSASTTVNPVDGTGAAAVIQVPVKREGLTGGTVSATVAGELFVGTLGSGEVKLASPADYTLGSPSVIFDEGDTLKYVSVTLKAAIKPGKFVLRLSAATGTGATLGSQVTTTITVNKKDTFAPSLTVNFPATPASSSSVTLTGVANEQGAVVTGIDRIEVTLTNLNNAATLYTTAQMAMTSPGFNTLSLSQPLTLENGSNKIVVTAFDKSGNKTMKTATIMFTDSNITALAGTYTGLLIPSSPTNDSSGLLTVTATTSTSVSGKITLGGVTVSFTGSLDSDGDVHFKPLLGKALAVIDKTDLESFLGSLSINIVGTTATGTLSTAATAGTTIATAAAAKQAAATSPATAANPGLLTGALGAQKYTAVFKSTAQAGMMSTSSYPQGDGYASITVSPNGSVAAVGALADGTLYSAAGKLHIVDGATQSVSLFSVLYRKGGSFALELVFDTSASTHASYDLLAANSLWIRPSLTHARYYAAGWPTGIVIDGVGARYTVPVGASVLPGLGVTSPNAKLTFTGTGLAANYTRLLDISVKNAFTNKSAPLDTALKLSISPATGIYKGTFTHPTGTAAFLGIVLQPSGQVSSGYFLDLPTLSYGTSGESGKVTLTPNP
jgi:uncharacterized repeat protein (TIGR02543 family)